MIVHIAIPSNRPPNMKGYDIKVGYLGCVNGKWMLFATEDEYVEYVKEISKNED